MLFFVWSLVVLFPILYSHLFTRSSCFSTRNTSVSTLSTCLFFCLSTCLSTCLSSGSIWLSTWSNHLAMRLSTRSTRSIMCLSFYNWSPYRPDYNYNEFKFCLMQKQPLKEILFSYWSSMFPCINVKEA